MDGNSKAGLPQDSSQAAPNRGNSQMSAGNNPLQKTLQTDTQLVVGMVLGSMFHDGGVQQIIQMVQQAGNDAPAAAAHAIYVGIAQARHALEQQGIPVDDKIWVMKGGVLNQLVAEVGKLLASALGAQFASRDFLAATAQAVVQIMKQQEQGEAEESSEEESAETPDEEAVEDGQGGLLAPQMQGGV